MAARRECLWRLRLDRPVAPRYEPDRWGFDKAQREAWHDHEEASLGEGRCPHCLGTLITFTATFPKLTGNIEAEVLQCCPCNRQWHPGATVYPASWPGRRKRDSGSIEVFTGWATPPPEINCAPAGIQICPCRNRPLSDPGNVID
jgi:hypothetical protein